MEKENWSRMVNLTSVRQVKIIIFAFLMLFISTKISATVTFLPNIIRAGKLFKLTVTTNDTLAVGRPISFRTERSTDIGVTWGPDVYGQLTPQGGQFGVIYGKIDSTQLPPTPTTPPTWTGYASYDYTKPFNKVDYIRIIAWWWTTAAESTDVTGYIEVAYYPDAGKGAIIIDHDPITSKDFSNGNGVKITIYPIPKGGETPAVKIFDSFGYLVKDVSSVVVGYQVTDSLYGVVYWNGRNEKGNKVANGVYEVCAKMINGKEAEICRRKFAVSR
jgi:hypothetical protein